MCVIIYMYATFKIFISFLLSEERIDTCLLQKIQTMQRSVKRQEKMSHNLATQR